MRTRCDSANGATGRSVAGSELGSCGSAARDAKLQMSRAIALQRHLLAGVGAKSMTMSARSPGASATFFATTGAGSSP